MKNFLKIKKKSYETINEFKRFKTSLWLYRKNI